MNVRYMHFRLIAICTALLATNISIYPQDTAQRSRHFISFIVPVYNRAVRVVHSLDSIYKQGLAQDEFEVICVNDGSQDATLVILNAYKEHHPNMYVINLERNQGAAHARNCAIKNSRGDLIFPLDSDNILAPNSIRRLVDLLDHTGCDIAAFEEIRYVDIAQQHIRSHFSRPEGGFITLRTMFSPSHVALGGGNYLYTRKSFDRAGGYQTYALETFTLGIAQMMTGSVAAVLPNSYYLHGLSEDSKWVSDEKQGYNTPTLVWTLLQFPEVFSPVGLEELKNYNFYVRQIYEDFENSIFELLPEQALDALFAGYKYEQNGAFNLASIAYKTAYSLGCNHPKVQKKIEFIEHILSSQE